VAIACKRVDRWRRGISTPLHSYPQNRKLSVNKYATQCDDGREDALLAYVFARPDLEELRGKPLKVAAAIDEFSFKTEFLISVGPRTFIPFPRDIPLVLLGDKSR